MVLDRHGLFSFLPLVIPEPGPLFLNLQALAPKRLEAAGGYFGWFLRLVQERQAKPAEFSVLLGRVVEHLETMPVAEQLRWQDLLSNIQTLIYHVRNPTEHEDLRETIERSVRTETHRQEVTTMAKTIAQDLMDRGRKEEAIRSRQQTLLRQLAERFGNMATETVSVVKKTKNVERLDTWLVRLVKADALEDIGIG